MVSGSLSARGFFPSLHSLLRIQIGNRSRNARHASVCVGTPTRSRTSGIQGNFSADVRAAGSRPLCASTERNSWPTKK